MTLAAGWFERGVGRHHALLQPMTPPPTMTTRRGEREEGGMVSRVAGRELLILGGAGSFSCFQRGTIGTSATIHQRGKASDEQ